MMKEILVIKTLFSALTWQICFCTILHYAKLHYKNKRPYLNQDWEITQKQNKPTITFIMFTGIYKIKLLFEHFSFSFMFNTFTKLRKFGTFLQPCSLTFTVLEQMSTSNF